MYDKVEGAIKRYDEIKTTVEAIKTSAPKSMLNKLNEKDLTL